MSVLGTGIAAGVSQTGLQAQQVARQVDRKKAQDEESARRVRERFEAHLHALEDPEKVESTDQIRVDDHSPREQPSQSQAKPKRPAQDADAEPSDQPKDPPLASLPPGKNDSDGPLYHHLDVQG